MPGTTASELERRGVDGPAVQAPRAWYVVIVLGLVYALNIADRYVMSVLIERRFSQFDLGLRPEAYALASLYAVLATAVLLLLFSSRRRRRRGLAGRSMRGRGA